MPGSRPAVLFDLDGTLCDTRSIEHLVAGDEPDYRAFHTASAGCPADAVVAEAARRAHREGRAVVIVSSREFIWRDLTMDWLVSQQIPYDGLYLRYSSDFRPAAVVKAELLGHVREDGFEPVEAWENHDAILELWRESGIPEVHDARVESSQSP